jgi:hypothetical protein|tara:strand:- start:109577 stop:109891 length:315 start_codon:yes stop_codon:yes gene_type:complete
MNGITKVFNWLAQHCNKEALFPKEWVLTESEKSQFRSIGYKVEDFQQPIIAPHYAMPPVGFYTVQHVTKANGDKLSAQEISVLEDMLSVQRDNSAPASPHRKPE